MRDIRPTYESIGIRIPRPFQLSAWQSIARGAHTVISAGTGSGKIEAAFLPALATGRRIIALYPTKALLQDQLPRIRHLAGDTATIAVDTGDEDDKSFYRADAILTSLDKFLYRFFGYGKKRWSYLYPYRIAFDDTRGTILILDEAHAYEEVAFSHFWFLLKKLPYERSVQTVLLSATLPPALIEALEDGERRHFLRTLDEGPFFEKVTDDEFRSGTLVYAGRMPPTDIVPKALDAFDRGRRVIVVLDAVVRPGEPKQAKGRTLQEIWARLVQVIASRAHDRSPEAVVARMDAAEGVKGNLLAYHGHQMPGYRTQVLRCLKDLDGWKSDESGRPRRGEPFILVTTSAMEVG
jgi:CRISPR-associated endonuclease/helicase Cas3